MRMLVILRLAAGLRACVRAGRSSFLCSAMPICVRWCYRRGRLSRHARSAACALHSRTNSRAVTITPLDTCGVASLSGGLYDSWLQGAGRLNAALVECYTYWWVVAVLRVCLLFWYLLPPRYEYACYFGICCRRVTSMLVILVFAAAALRVCLVFWIFYAAAALLGGANRIQCKADAACRSTCELLHIMRVFCVVSGGVLLAAWL